MRMLKSIKWKKSSGFTLIEVIASMALFATVSVVLLQMFTVSGKTNRVAYELDTANSICVNATEMYKDDPRDGTADQGTYLLEPQFFRNDILGDDIIYTQNIDGRFELEITSTKGATTTMPISYYPAAAHEYTFLTAVTSIDLELSKDPDDGHIDISVNGNTYAPNVSNIIYSDSTSIAKTAMIPIHLNCAKIGSSIELNVTNNIGILSKGSVDYEAIADIYLCDIGTGGNITLKVVNGMATESKITKKNQSITKYTGVIRVKRIADGTALAETTAEDYWVGN